MSIGKITNSLTSATIEPSFSLVQFNFDFTYKKSEAPVEYKAVGNALSISRRHNAENGSAHRTAMKLSWLFEQIIPNTPELLKAYGQRVSDILQTPGINPVGSTADGPFRDFVGADCTYLWAAATSGIPALGVHLLACMLARAWDAQQATAIWVELVQSRKAEILQNLSQNVIVSETSIAAARQDILRAELGDWDTSARAWLGQADTAELTNREKFLRVTNRISLTTGNNTSPYPNVISAWTEGMRTLERHFEGTSQQISDGAVLYAISSWHLYPDLAYFGRGVETIRFGDHLFTKPATMTLGLNEVKTCPENRGIHWSLALSHLLYYGDPVPVEAVQDRTRVSIPQFQVVILGAVLESWRVPASQRLNAVRWIKALWDYLNNHKINGLTEYHLSESTSWLASLAGAADTILSAVDTNNSSLLGRYENYLSHGELHGREFLLASGEDLEPYFGLCNPSIMAALQEPLDVDAGVQYLRQICQVLGLGEGEAIICYSEVRKGWGYFEYCTGISHPTGGDTSRHARWLKIAPVSNSDKSNCYHSSHKRSQLNPLAETDLGARMAMIQSRGEIAFSLQEGSLGDEKLSSIQASSRQSGYLVWDDPPSSFARAGNCVASANCCNCLEPRVTRDGFNSQESTKILFSRYRGTSNVQGQFELYIRSTLSQPLNSPRFDEAISRERMKAVKPQNGLHWFECRRPNPNRIWDYLGTFGRSLPEEADMEEPLPASLNLDWKYSHARTAELIFKRFVPRPSRDWVLSLELVGVISQIYKGLPSATISLEVLEYPLLEGHWTKLGETSGTVSMAHGTGLLLDCMSREGTLACIAMMQTGVSNIRPEELEGVMAMSADNSIFVAAALLSDPCEKPHPTKIRHIVGNVGFAGLSLMVTPAQSLKIYPRDKGVRVLPQSLIYEGERKDTFKDTSLHISFTGQRLPLVITDMDTIDQGIFYVQSIVSLWDKGKHIADLDLLKLSDLDITRVELECSCLEVKAYDSERDMRKLESWQDVLTPPRRTAIMQSYGNWPARLAAVALLTQEQKGHVVAVLGPGPLCWKCLEELFQIPEDHMPEILID
ncbi:hypothetical protein V493_00322 [Pseudogymnoascus sp. VKM F-4281 (FW-2241)]|nr:hypothetical protein V493_00322 [Pseudogymnoascus sp. VKM F-4281 (FW-2241)]